MSTPADYAVRRTDQKATVGNLIKALQAFPPDMLVGMVNYYDDFGTIGLNPQIRQVSGSTYDSDDRNAVDDGTTVTFDAVMLTAAISLE